MSESFDDVPVDDVPVDDIDNYAHNQQPGSGIDWYKDPQDALLQANASAVHVRLHRYKEDNWAQHEVPDSLQDFTCTDVEQTQLQQ